MAIVKRILCNRGFASMKRGNFCSSDRMGFFQQSLWFGFRILTSTPRIVSRRESEIDINMPYDRLLTDTVALDEGFGPSSSQKGSRVVAMKWATLTFPSHLTYLKLSSLKELWSANRKDLTLLKLVMLLTSTSPQSQQSALLSLVRREFGSAKSAKEKNRQPVLD